MGWFNIFSKSKVDKGILDMYLEIELLITEIDKIFQEYISYVFSSGYYNSNPKDKKFYSIQQINYFFKKLKEDYAYCYTLRKNKKHYDFTSNAESRAQKSEIEVRLKSIINLLNHIYANVNNLKKTDIKNNDLSELIKYIEEFVKTEKILKEVQEKDERAVYTIIEDIQKESGANERNKIWLLNQADKKTKLYFSQNIHMGDIKYLDLVPLLVLKGLEKRSLFINELHKDEVLPVYHYNLELNGRNIHVIPRNYKERIKSYLIAA